MDYKEWRALDQEISSCKTRRQGSLRKTPVMTYRDGRPKNYLMETERVIVIRHVW